MRSDEFLNYINQLHRHKFPEDMPFNHNTIEIYKLLAEAVERKCDLLLFGTEGVVFKRASNIIQTLPQHINNRLIRDIRDLINNYFRIYEYDAVIRQVTKYKSLLNETLVIKLINIDHTTP